MMCRSRAPLIASAALLLFAVGWLMTGIGEAQTQPLGAEVRPAAKLLADGRIEVELQYRWNGVWRRADAPAQRFLPADAEEDRWLVSAPVAVASRQTQVTVGVQYPRWDGGNGPGEFVVSVDGRRYRSNCGQLELELDRGRLRLQTFDAACEEWSALAEQRLASPGSEGRQDARIAARRSEGRVQLAVQHRQDGGWSERLVPENAWLPERPMVGLWYASPAIALPPPPVVVSGQLHREAALSVRGGEFQIAANGQRYRGNCGALDLRTFGESVLVDSLDAGCTEQTALAAICGPDVRQSDCDVQINHAYQWEDARLRQAAAKGVELDLAEAQLIVNAVYGDYFSSGRRPPLVVRSSRGSTHYDGGRHRIELAADWGLMLDVVLHETAHALLAGASVRDPGHGGRFVALLLALWDRYLPIVDTGAARAAAIADGLEIAESVQPLARRSTGVEDIRRLLCVRPVRSERLCRAFAGELDAGAANVEATQSGSVGDLWWYSEVDADTGTVRTALARESIEQPNGDSVARLSISCESGGRLEFEVWWRGLESVPPLLSWRVGGESWRRQSWQTSSDGTWSGDTWAIHRAVDAALLLQRLYWQADTAEAFQVQTGTSLGVMRASFKLSGLFETPVQDALAECGIGSAAEEADELVVDSGRMGPNFGWGVKVDDDPPGTYVVRETAVSGSSDRARLQVSCDQGVLELDVYWGVDRDVDQTVHYQIADGEVQQEEWVAGTASRGDSSWKWTGREDAADLIAKLAWAAQSGGAFVVEAHERRNPNRRWTVSFDLAGLFETPVQPNLARCGR